MRRTWRGTRLLVLGIAIIVLGAISSCTRTVTVVGAASPSSSATASSQSPVGAGSPSSPTSAGAVTTFSDGTSASLYNSSGGDNGVLVTLVVTAGHSGLDLASPDAFRVQPVDNSGDDPWSQADAPTYNGMGNAPDLQPGQSVCFQQSFEDYNDQPPVPGTDVSGFMVTVTQPGGAPESATLTLYDGKSNCP